MREPCVVRLTSTYREQTAVYLVDLHADTATWPRLFGGYDPDTRTLGDDIAYEELAHQVSSGESSGTLGYASWGEKWKWELI